MEGGRRVYNTRRPKIILSMSDATLYNRCRTKTYLGGIDYESLFK